MAFLVTAGQARLEARALNMVSIFNADRLRDPHAEPPLMAALRRQDVMAARTVRRDPHPADESCWLHGPDVCLSRTMAA